MLPVVSILSISLGLYYYYLLKNYTQNWNGLEKFLVPGHTDDFDDFVSIVIVARNEEEYIKHCLLSIDQSEFPKKQFEIILIDDHSSDNTITLAKSLHLQNLKILNLHNSIGNKEVNSYKKYGQKMAVREAKGDYILMTDADVVVGPHWIQTMYTHIKTLSKYIATGPVKYKSSGSVLHNFQALDVAGTMFMTAAGHRTKSTFLANGANMIVRKKAFQEVLGTEDDSIASGDDVFLMQKIAEKHKSKVGFVKSASAVVTTYPEETWSAFFQQRLRWATKTTSYQNKQLTSKIALIFIFNLVLFTNLILGLFFSSALFYVALVMLVLKIAAEVNLLRPAIKYFNLKVSTWSLPFYSLLNHCYLLVIGTLALSKKEYYWKGRRVR